MDQVKIGKLIAKCRKEKNLTQNELAELLQVSNKTISKWECGSSLPDVSRYKELCDILGITLNEFFAGEKIKEKEYKEKAEKNLLDLAKINKGRSEKYRIIFLSLLAGICLILFITYLTIKKISNAWIGSSDAIVELEDGWYYELHINYHTKNIAEYVIGKANYKHIGDCEEKTSKSITIDACSLHHNLEEEQESLYISKYFNRHQFNRKISEKDLKGLKLKFYDKKYIIDLYNKAISKTPEKEIKIKIDNHSKEIRYDEIKNGYRVVIGSSSARSGINIFKIDLEYESGEFLSDLVLTKEVTNKQVEIYNNFQEISSYFIETQDLNIRKKFNLKEEVYDRAFNIIESIEYRNY